MCVHLGDVLFDSFWTMWKGLRVEDRHRMLRAIGAVAPGWQSLASMLKVFQFNPVWSLFRGLVLSAGMRGHIRAWRHRRLAWLGETDCWRQSLCFTASLAFTLQAAKSRRRVSRTWAMCKSMVAKLLRYAGYIRVRCSEVEQPVVVPQRERERAIPIHRYSIGHRTMVGRHVRTKKYGWWNDVQWIPDENRLCTSEPLRYFKLMTSQPSKKCIAHFWSTALQQWGDWPNSQPVAY